MNEIEKALKFVEGLEPTCETCLFRTITGVCKAKCESPETTEVFRVIHDALSEKLDGLKIGVNHENNR